MIFVVFMLYFAFIILAFINIGVYMDYVEKQFKEPNVLIALGIFGLTLGALHCLYASTYNYLEKNHTYTHVETKRILGQVDEINLDDWKTRLVVMIEIQEGVKLETKSIRGEVLVGSDVDVITVEHLKKRVTNPILNIFFPMGERTIIKIPEELSNKIIYSL